ncbi:hypothetical protein CI238_01737 [Colletotrichum incanum]|uniref:Uncharacterized protein n=1 Tax=Colletotrichum incanum TaxID=1573173 RepID=A0A167BV97_COLIC|nr:hypothetical protein CI238_01737 [Colletotrichum incanum]
MPRDTLPTPRVRQQHTLTLAPSLSHMPSFTLRGYMVKDPLNSDHKRLLRCAVPISQDSIDALPLARRGHIFFNSTALKTANQDPPQIYEARDVFELGSDVQAIPLRVFLPVALIPTPNICLSHMSRCPPSAADLVRGKERNNPAPPCASLLLV